MCDKYCPYAGAIELSKVGKFSGKKQFDGRNKNIRKYKTKVKMTTIKPDLGSIEEQVQSEGPFMAGTPLAPDSFSVLSPSHLPKNSCKEACFS